MQIKNNNNFERMIHNYKIFIQNILTFHFKDIAVFVLDNNLGGWGGSGSQLRVLNVTPKKS